MATTRKQTPTPEKKQTAPQTAEKRPTSPQQQPLQAAGNAPDAARMSKRTASREEIARRAHELWIQRGGGHGNDHEDWLRAERELSGKDS